MEQWRKYWEGKVDEIWIWKAHTFGGNLSGYEAVQKRGTAKSCGRPFLPFKDLDIKVDGRVTICCFDPFAELCIGDINERPLKEILIGSEKLREIQEVHKNCFFSESGLICKIATKYMTGTRLSFIRAIHKEKLGKFIRTIKLWFVIIVCLRSQYEFKNRYMYFELFTKTMREAAEMGIKLVITDIPSRHMRLSI